MEKLPKGKHSTKGLGKTAPEKLEFVQWRDQIVVPCGKPVRSDVRASELLYNEYIVYDTAQVRSISYLSLYFCLSCSLLFFSSSLNLSVFSPSFLFPFILLFLVFLFVSHYLSLSLSFVFSFRLTHFIFFCLALSILSLSISLPLFSSLWTTSLNGR